MKSRFQESLLKSAEVTDFFIPENAAGAFELYYRELLAWNAKVNLTAIVQPEDAAIKHFLDSVLIMKYLPPLTGVLVDVGSGAGFPGIPLKIMNPGLSVVLVEAARKKASYLKHVLRLLKLTGIEVYNGRVEAYDRPGAFDYAVSRAFSGLGLFCRVAAPLIKPGGRLLAMKGRDNKELLAVREIPPGGFSCAAVHAYGLPRQKGERSLVVLEKCFT